MTDKRFRSTMVEYGWIRFQAKRQQQLELVVASWVIRKGGGSGRAKKSWIWCVKSGGFQRSRGNLEFQRAALELLFVAMAAEPAAQQECTLGQVDHCDVSVLCYVVWWEWWAQVWQIKTAANKRRQMDSEFMVDGECMWMLQRFLLSQLVNRLIFVCLFHFAQPNGS